MCQFHNSSLDEGLRMAERWRQMSRAQSAIKRNGAKTWTEPTHTAGTLFRWKDKSPDYDILVYDGGAMSEDGLLAIRLPLVDSVINDKDRLEEYLSAFSEENRGFNLIDAIGISGIITPIEMLKLCLKNAWKPPEFEILFDKT